MLRGLVLFGLLPLFVACGGESKKSLVLNDSVKRDLMDILTTANGLLHNPGTVMAVQVGDSEPWIAAVGVANPATGEPMAITNKFRVGSITKNFVAVAILQLAQEGKLSLDDTLEKWLPGAIASIDGNKITIRQLLNHTSGIESYTADPAWITKVYLEPTHLWNSPQDQLDITNTLHTAAVEGDTSHDPGEGFYYSNTNYILLGMIAAKADGKSDYAWDQVVRERFIDKLGLKATSIPVKGDTGLFDSNTHGVVNWMNFIGRETCPKINPACADQDVDFTVQEMSNAWSAGAIISDIRDLLTWTRAQMRGDLLTAETKAQQHDFKETYHGPLRVGLGQFLELEWGNYGHRGEIFGFNGTIQYQPDGDATIVVLTNRTALDGNHVGPVVPEVLKALFPGGNFGLALTGSGGPLTYGGPLSEY